MTEIPMWWLIFSAIFFVLQSILVFCLIYFVIRLMGTIREITPKVVAISEKVHEIGIKVEDLTTNVKQTMETLGTRAKSVAGSADLIAHTAARSFERFSPAVVAILSGLKILRAVQEFRSSHNSRDRPKSGKGSPKADPDVDNKDEK